MTRFLIISALSGWLVAAVLFFSTTGETALASGTVAGAPAAPMAPCTGDLDGNGLVNVVDLLDLLGAWGICPDADGDGFTILDGDCDDTDPAINPGATEICNLIDDNCNGFVDEGCPLILLALQPATGQVSVGNMLTMTVVVNDNSHGGIVVTLSASPGFAVSIPPTVTILDGDYQATFEVTGISPGTETITASYDGVDRIASIEVVD